MKCTCGKCVYNEIDSIYDTFWYYCEKGHWELHNYDGYTDDEEIDCPDYEEFVN